VATDPNVNWVFVVDCLNVHQSASLVEWVAKTCELDQELGKKSKHGILESQATRREFLSDPEHRIRFVYLPKHSLWLNQVEIEFGMIMRKVIRRGNFTLVAVLEAKLQAFLACFNAVLAHPFNWTNTGKPLEKSRPPPVCPPSRRQRFATKLNLAKTAFLRCAVDHPQCRTGAARRA
jgi:hypothetical protein